MRKLAIFTGAFSLGIFLAQYLLPFAWLLPGAGVAFLLAWGRLFLPERWGRRLLLGGVGLSLALGWNWLYVRQVQPAVEALSDQECALSLTVCDYAEATDFGARVTARAEGLPGKIMYYGGAELLDLTPGQTVEAVARVQNAARIRDDDITNFTSKGIYLLAYQRGEASVGEGNPDSLRWWPIRLGHAMSLQVNQLYSGDVAAFLSAILTGDTSGLSDAAYWDLSEAGLLHILAVSGMHCSFLLTLMELLIGRHRRRLLAGSTVCLLIFYAFLTGCSPSVVRACLMLGMVLAAPLCRRESDGPTSLLTALFLILLENPYAAASISLQLSFGAVAGLLWVTPKLHRLLAGDGRHGRIFRFVEAGFSTTLGALVFTVPLSALYFGTLTLIAPVSNLLGLAASTAVFMVGLPAVLLSFLCQPLGWFIGLVPAALIRYILEAARLLGEIPHHTLYFDNPYLKYWLGFVYLLFLAAYLLGPKARRKYILAAGCGAVTLAATVQLGSLRNRADLDVYALDVGQGQSILLTSGGRAALTDCGSGNSWYHAGQVAVYRLRSLGYSALDYLILTHYDSDHVNGAVTVLERMDVGILLAPEAGEDTELRRSLLDTAASRGTEVRTLTEETLLPLGQAQLRVYPPAGEERDDNNSGLAVLAALEETDLLITGDMDTGAERTFLAAYRGLPDLEYLVAGHHGSRTSTSEELLDALTPETVLISVGSNSYGHPTEETLRRLAERDCAVYRTDLHGTIHLSIQGDSHEEQSE